jgi:transcription-repair coupling factor (superfamily II helicase)
MYQRIARVTRTDEIETIAQELADRFGPVPEAAKMLLVVTEIGLLAGRLRIQGLVQRKGMLAATFAEFPPSDPRIISEMYANTQFPMRIISGPPLQVVMELGKGNAVELAEKALKEFRAFAVIKADSVVTASRTN